MESLGETDIVMLEYSEERFLLDSIGMLFLGYSVGDCQTPTVELSIRDDCSLENARRIRNSSTRLLNGHSGTSI